MKIERDVSKEAFRIVEEFMSSDGKGELNPLNEPSGWYWKAKLEMLAYRVAEAEDRVAVLSGQVQMGEEPAPCPPEEVTFTYPRFAAPPVDFEKIALRNDYLKATQRYNKWFTLIELGPCFIPCLMALLGLCIPLFMGTPVRSQYVLFGIPLFFLVLMGGLVLSSRLNRALRDHIAKKFPQFLSVM